MNRYIPLILAGVTLNALAQLSLKQGMRTIGHFSFSLKNVIPIALQASFNVYIILGMSCYVLSVVLWLLVLSRVDVSYAYPLLSVGYIIAAIAGKVFFDEALGFDRITGILIICIGVYFITRSG